MAYTETTNTSYGQRLSGSMKGIVSGLLMFIIGTCLLWWNEGRAVKTSKAIKEAESVAVHVDDVSTVDASLNGKLIHASAFADTKDTLADDIFGVRTLAIKLNRKVEYYQWIENSKSETRDKIGGGQETVTTYTYESKWVDKPVKSSEFKEPELCTDYHRRKRSVGRQRDLRSLHAAGVHQTIDQRKRAGGCTDDQRAGARMEQGVAHVRIGERQRVAGTFG